MGESCLGFRTCVLRVVVLRAQVKKESKRLNPRPFTKGFCSECGKARFHVP